MMSDGVLPRLEFHSNIQWAPAYQRNNKANGQKNLRCFPNHCQGLGHQRGFCGHSIVTNFYFAANSISGKLFAFSHFCIDDSELNTPAVATAKGTSLARFTPGDILSVQEVKSKLRNADAPLKEYIEGAERQDRRLENDQVIRVSFEYNRSLRGWHYGFLGSKLTRNCHHTFRSMVLEHIPATPTTPDHYRVLAVAVSPKWKLFCRRRNRVGVLPSKQEQTLPSAAQRAAKLLEAEREQQLAQLQILQDGEMNMSIGRADPVISKIAIPRFNGVPPRHPSRNAPDNNDRTGMATGRRFKKRRDTTPDLPVRSEVASSSIEEPRSTRSRAAPPRRHTSCPSTDTSNFFGFSSSSNLLTQYLQNSDCDENQQNASNQVKPEPMEKKYVRRLASQERLGVSGRSLQTRKRTSSDEPGNTGGDGEWVKCFVESSVTRSQSIPSLSLPKPPPLPSGPVDPRRVVLITLLEMIDAKMDDYDVDAPLNLIDHSKFQLFVDHVSELLMHFAAQSSEDSVKTKERQKLVYRMDYANFTIYLLKKKSFANKLMEFARTKSEAQRKSDPYGTTSFILQLLKDHLNAFQKLVRKHGKKRNNSVRYSAGSVPPLLFRQQQQHQQQQQQQVESHNREILDSDIGQLYPCMSTLSLKMGNHGLIKRNLSMMDMVDLDKFTQELDTLDPLSKQQSWKLLSSTMSRKFSSNFMASFHSDQSLLNSLTKASMFSLNIPSSLCENTPSSNTNSHHNHRSNSAEGQAMQELDEFLKKEGVQEVEEVNC